VVVSGSSAGLVWIFWTTRPDWVSEMRLWKALGDAAFVLLVAALAVTTGDVVPGGMGWGDPPMS
jgi:hypothetical protein